MSPIGASRAGIRGRPAPETGPPPSGVSHWDFDDDGTTNTAADSWGNQDLSLSSPVYTSSAKVGTHALSFDGNDDTAEITSGWPDVGDTFTWLGWVRADSTISDFGVICVTGAAGGNRLFKFLINTDSSGNMRALLGDGNSGELVVGSLNYSISTWYHIAITWDGTDFIWYVDGSQSDITTDSTFTTTSRGEFFLGGDALNNRNYADVTLDHIKVYDRALSLTEIQDEYNNTK